MKLNRRFLAILVLPFFSTAHLAASQPAATASRTGEITRDELIRAQSRIERIYYNHRLWPKENPGPKPAFEAMVPATLIEKKANEPLRMSAALKQYWNVEITPAQLQNEMARMERDSKDRAMLHELFAALGNDPYLIAETLARSNLAEKTLHNHYAFDASLHAEARRRAEAIAAQVKKGAAWSGVDANYSRRKFQLDNEVGDGSPAGLDPTEGRAPGRGQQDVIRLPAEELAALRKRLTHSASSPLREDENGWWLERISADDVRGLEVESLFISKRSFDEWWAEASKVGNVEG